MDNVWTYRDTSWAQDQDLIGYDVEATDGSIGKIDEATTAADRAHVVVDTGFWILEKKRLIPAGAITSVDHADRKVGVAMTKDQIKDAPDYEPGGWNADVRTRHESYYGPFSR